MLEALHDLLGTYAKHNGLRKAMNLSKHDKVCVNNINRKTNKTRTNFCCREVSRS